MCSREAIETVVYGSCLALDEKDFDAYLSLCDDDYQYKITAFSPEIKRDMTWLEHDKKGMATLLQQLPRHNNDHSPLSRHATIYQIDVNSGTNQADVVSALQVFKTGLDGGSTTLYAVGKLYDTVKIDGDRAALLCRNVRLDTRELGIGYHIPF